MANLAQLLAGQAARQPGAPAILAGDRELSYADFDELSARVAAFLASRGFPAGGRAGLMLANVPEMCVLFYGILRAGGVVVPMNPLLKAREVEYYLGDSGATVLFAAKDSPGEPAEGAAAAGAEFIPSGADDLAGRLAVHPPVREMAGRADEDTAVILYTSGTTGQPKGAELTHANLRTNAQVTEETLLGLTPADVVMGGLPLFHSFGLTCGLNAAVNAGAALALLSRFDPGRALEVIQDRRITVFEGVPTMYAALLHHPHRDRYDVSSLRLCVSGGAALPVELLRAFEQAFSAVILEGYGLSETSPVASFNQPGRERKPGSIGTPVRGVRMRLVGPDGGDVPPGETGEIAISGPNVMKGYWGRPEATREAIPDGWLRTGDLVTVDPGGTYTFVARKKEVLRRRGENLSPAEVEEVLTGHPDVQECAVVGVPSELSEDEVKAFVVPVPGRVPDFAALRVHTAARLAAFKVPRYWQLIDELPRTPTARVAKHRLPRGHPPEEYDAQAVG